MVEIKKINRLSDAQSLIVGDRIIVNGGIYTYVKRDRDEESIELIMNIGNCFDTISVKNFKLDGRGGMIALQNSRTFYKGEQI